MTEQWGADTIISMPVPFDGLQQPLVDLGGLAITEHGYVHNLTTSDLEVFLTPTFRPLIGSQGT